MNAEELHIFNENLKSFRAAFGKPLAEQKTLVQNGIRQYRQAVATHEGKLIMQHTLEIYVNFFY